MKGSLRRIWTIAVRELGSLFDHPTGYVLLVVLLAGNGFLFFRQAYLSGLASLRPMLDLLPWLFLFFVPAVTMRALAEDHRSGMLEVVLTQPITELELLLGKYVGAVLFLWIALALTLPIPLGLALGAHMQWGTVLAQYMGAALLAVGLAAAGIWASSLTRSQITAFILSVAITFVLILVGLDPLLVGLPPGLGAIAARLGVLSHFQNIGRGVIDLRDAIYFVSLAGVFLALAYASVAGRLLSPTGTRRKRLRLGVAIIVVLVFVVNLLGGYIGGRLDLTPGHAYTLSSGAKQIVSHLPDVLTVKVFASDELPPEAALLKRDVDDLLSDLKSASHGKIRVLRLNPSTDSVAAQDARELGVQAVQFNTVGAAELQVKEGYLGIVLQYGDQHQTIPFVSQTNDLEYQLAADIQALTRPTKPVIGLVATTDPTSGAGGDQQLESQLATTYTVRDISLDDPTQPAPDVKALVLVGAPDSLPAGAVERLDAFFHRGGGALILAGGMHMAEQEMFAEPQPVVWDSILAPFGVSIRSDMVYDLAANEMVPSQSSAGPFQVMRPYPFFVRAQSTDASVVNRDAGELFMPWASSIDTTHAAKGTVTPLIVSSRASGVSNGPTTLDPSRAFPQTDLAPRLLAVQVQAKSPQDTSLHGRVIVVANSDFVADQFVQHAPDNLGLALDAVDWLAQDEALSSIRSANRTPPALTFTSAALEQGVKYFAVIGVPLLVALFGGLRMTRRRARTKTPYHPLASGGPAHAAAGTGGSA